MKVHRPRIALTEYIEAHGKRPGGYGRWVFKPKDFPPIVIVDNYETAAREARHWAFCYDCRLLRLLP